MLAEIYPTSVRGTGHGFTFNVARGLSAMTPFAVGFLADRHGVGAALVLNSGFFLVAAALIFTRLHSQNNTVRITAGKVWTSMAKNS